MFTELTYICQKCSVKLKRLVKVFQPEEFHPEGTKSILFQSWCDKCKEPIALRYNFKKENEQIRAAVIAYVPVTTAIAPKYEGDKDPLTARPALKNSRGGSHA